MCGYAMFYTIVILPKLAVSLLRTIMYFEIVSMFIVAIYLQDVAVFTKI